MEHEDFKQGARTRNAVPSGARDVPLLLFCADQQFEFYVSKALLEEGLKYIAEGHDAEQRQARRRQIFSNLIARSRK